MELKEVVETKYKELIDIIACYLFSISDDCYCLSYFSDFIKEYDNSKHEGDCTQQPFTCNQCLIDSYRNKAILLINKDNFIKYIVEEEIDQLYEN